MLRDNIMSSVRHYCTHAGIMVPGTFRRSNELSHSRIKVAKEMYLRAVSRIE